MAPAYCQHLVPISLPLQRALPRAAGTRQLLCSPALKASRSHRCFPDAPTDASLVLFLLGLLPSLVGFSGHHCLAFSPAPSAGQPAVTEGHGPPQIPLCPTQNYTARNSPYELQNAAESPFQNGQIHPLSLPLLPQTTGASFFIFYF